MTTQDLQAPFDPTAYAGVSGAQILQLINGASPATNVGMFILSTDIAAVPQVPNANTTTKWQNYGWIRKSATGVTLYIWNPFAANDPTLLYWQSVSVTNLGVGTVTTLNLADNSVTDAKIANVSYSKIINPPAGLPPSGIAGGDLTGNYPNPSVAAGAITGAKIAALTILGGNIADNTIGQAKLTPSLTNGVVMATIAGQSTWFVPSPAALSAGITLAASQIPTVKADGTDFQMQTVVQLLNTARYTSGLTGTISTFSAGPVIHNPHGLASTPRRVGVTAVCTTNDNGYVAGDEVDSEAMYCRTSVSQTEKVEPLFICGTSDVAGGINTYVYVVMTSLVAGALINNKTTGVSAALTLTSWKIKVWCDL